LKLHGRIARVTDGPGGQRVVFRYKDTQYEYDHISFFFKRVTEFKVGDHAVVELKKIDTAAYDDTSWHDSQGRI
jgi:hypothetical protein